MNIRKTIDYSALYAELDALMGQSLPQMELYHEIGRLVCSRAEKGAAIMASEYLRENHSNIAGFSPRNVRRIREFIRTYKGNEALMAEAMKIGWTQNVLIMERCADDAERQWYIKTVLCFGWSKLELAAKIDDETHLKMSLASQEEVYDTENRGADKTNNSEPPEPPHKFAAVPSVCVHVSVAEESSSRAKARGHPSRYRWNFPIVVLSSQKRPMSEASIAVRRQLTLYYSKITTNDKEHMEMKKNCFTSVKELPIMLSISQVAAVLNISRASAYELAHCKNFPAMLIGCRIVVPRDKLLAWIDARVAMNELCG